MNDKKILFGIISVTIIGLGIWLFSEAKPKPGQLIDDLGRGHVPIGTEIKYNSNPPTSGQHYDEWTKAGVYDQPKDDRFLLHSLEHGYIIISYNCSLSQTGNATESAQLSDDFKSPSCQDLVNKLKDVYNDKGPHKLVIIPRPILDAKIALTAWRYLDKFNPSTSSGLSSDDKSRIEKFIDSHRDQGPEKTVEP